MSLYGALFAGVSGLDAQSTSLGIISNNISNSNTIGYKAGQVQFSTLVTGSSSTTTYSPGGVHGGSRQLNDQQGLLQGTNSATDIAIQGGGLFVVNQAPDGSGSVLYTRAGSFTQDSTGNFVNSAGYFLQAWPLDRSGNLPGAPGNTDTTSSANLSSLKTVNVQNLTGAAAATTTVAFSANLNAGASIYPGSSVKVNMDPTNELNTGINGNAIIVPGGPDSLSAGDKMVVSTGSGLSYTYTYGGYTYSRSVGSGVGAANGTPLDTPQTTLSAGGSTLDSATTMAVAQTLSSSSFSTNGTDGVVTINAPLHGLNTGDTVTISGATNPGVGGIAAANLNGTFQVTVLDNGHYTINTGGTSTSVAIGGTGSEVATVVPLATTSGSKVITVTAPTHNLTTNDWITIAGETSAIGGIAAADLNGTFQVTVIDANHYSYVSPSVTPATSAAPGGDAPLTSTINPFSTSNGSTDVVITQPNNHLIAGDYVTISGVTTGVGGLTTELNGTFKVKTVNADGNHYTIDVGAPATSTAHGGSGTSGIDSVTKPFSVAINSSTVTVFQPSHGLHTGSVVNISGNTDPVGTIPAGDINGSFVVTVIDANHYTLTAPVVSTVAAGGGAGTIIATTRPFAGNIMDATTPNQPFLGTTGTAGFTAAAMTFSITTPATGTKVFTYAASSPNSQQGQFNNMTNLATAINSVSGLSARVVNNQLYVAATDGNASITFANGSTSGSNGPPVQAGLDWLGELGVGDVIAATNRFSSLQGLTNLVNASTGMTATLSNPLGASSLTINTDDPLDTVTFSDKPNAPALPSFTNPTPFATTAGRDLVTIAIPTTTVRFNPGDIISLDSSALPGVAFNGIPKQDFTGKFVVVSASSTSVTIQVAHPATQSGATGATGLILTPPNNTGSVLSALGITPSLRGAPFTPQTTGALGPAYDSTVSAKNIASGAITAQFSRPVTVYDAQGTSHNLIMGFIKTGENTWGVEVYAQPKTDVNSTLPDGQVAYGTLTFNGDGSLQSVSSTLSQLTTIDWNGGASPSEVAFNWGTAGQPFGTPNASSIGKTDGVAQLNADYNVNFVNQNGAPVGQLTSVTIDENGYITASYTNGETQKLYKIPLASFSNPDRMQNISGNVFAQTSDSGVVNLKQPGSNGVGTISANSLESSNVELADQLTNMIVAQRAYQANTKVISTADQLLSDLDQILQ